MLILTVSYCQTDLCVCLTHLRVIPIHRINEHKMLKWSPVKSIAYSSYFSVAPSRQSLSQFVRRDLLSNMETWVWLNSEGQSRVNVLTPYLPVLSKYWWPTENSIFRLGPRYEKKSPCLSNSSATAFSLRKLLGQARLHWVNKAYLGEWHWEG